MGGTNKEENGNQNGIFEYILEDFLEIKACLEAEKTKPIKDFLSSQGTSGFSLKAVEGFALGPQLVLIREDNPQSFRHLVFLHPEHGRIRVRSLRR